MKKKIFKRPVIFIVIISIIIISLVGWAVFFRSTPKPDDKNTLTLNQGRQIRYNEISIALGNVTGNSGWISVHKDGEKEDSVKKSFKTGDKVDVYGYTIEIKSVKSVTNLSTMPGSNNGYIKFIINKK